eukprot:Opistho-2@46592
MTIGSGSETSSLIGGNSGISKGPSGVGERVRSVINADMDSDAIDTSSVEDPGSDFESTPLLESPPRTQSSIVTIFSIWNTMIGTSLLTMPWAIQQAGFALGLICVLLMGLLCLYTCTLVVKHGSKLATKRDVEFPDICRHHLGDRVYYVAVGFSMLTLIGAMIVYWVLMSNFLFKTVDYIHGSHTEPMSNVSVTNMSFIALHDSGNATSSEASSHWTDYWNLNYSALYLVIIVFPLVNFKSLSFFTKFNALGVASIFYIIALVSYNAAKDGVHLDSTVKQAGVDFFSLTGVLSLSFFIHTGCLSIMRNQAKPANNTRDLTIAYVLVGMTYLIVGIIYFISYPKDKSLIESNLLDNFGDRDVMAVVARVFLLFQMITVYPLLMYIVRSQFMSVLFGNEYPNVWYVLLHNSIITAICVLFGVFYRKVGDIIRFTGAFCGLIYVFALPCAVHLIILHRKGRMTRMQLVVHGAIVLLGFINLVGQFAIL